MRQRILSIRKHFSLIMQAFQKRKEIKKRILSICMSMVLFVGLFLSNDINAEAAEYKDGFKVTMRTDDQLAAGAQVTLDITVTNTSGKDLMVFDISHDCNHIFDKTGELSGSFGTLYDSEGKELLWVDEDGKFLRKEFKSGDTKIYTWSGTLPGNWSRANWLYFCVWAEEDENSDVIYSGNARVGGPYPGENDEKVSNAFQVNVTADGKVAAGQQAVFDIKIKNISGVVQMISMMDYWCDRNVDYLENSTPIQFDGKLTDSKGNEITRENMLDIEFSVGETKEYKITGIAPSAWGEKSQFTLVVTSEGKNGKWYVGTGSYPDFSEPVIPELPDSIGVVMSGNLASSITVSRALLAECVLTAVELAGSDSFEVVLNTNEVEESAVSEDDKVLIIKSAGGRKIVQILDLTIQKNNKTQNTVETVSKLFAPINITIQIPEEYRNISGRKFSVIRLHGDVATVLEDLDSNPDTVTISTDEFSLYALAYEDGTGTGTAASAGTGQNNSNSGASGTAEVVVRAATPRTGDTANITLYLVLCLVTAGIMAGIYIRNRRTGKSVL